jgi:hypothetical protein
MRQSLPATRGPTSPSSPTSPVRQGFCVLVPSSFCATQALATMELWFSLSFLVKQNKTSGSGFGVHSGVVF